jgi:hypothetical protein
VSTGRISDCGDLGRGKARGDKSLQRAADSRYTDRRVARARELARAIGYVLKDTLQGSFADELQADPMQGVKLLIAGPAGLHYISYRHCSIYP